MGRPELSLKYAICNECGKMFEYKVLRDPRCPDCKKNAIHAKERAERRARSHRKHVKSDLERAVDEIAKYNREHGTNYTYGTYMGKFGIGGR